MEVTVKWVRCVSVGTIFLLLSATICTFSCSRPESYKKSPVVAEVTEFMFGIEAVYAEKGEYPFCSKSVNAVTNLSSVLCFLQAVPCLDKEGKERTISYVNIDKERDNKEGYTDPWGRPYHLILKSDKSSVLKVGRFDISNNVAIWSNGPNRINESGEGDDICSWNIAVFRKKENMHNGAR